jgi:hypothetical protein
VPTLWFIALQPGSNAAAFVHLSVPLCCGKTAANFTGPACIAINLAADTVLQTLQLLLPS